MMKVSSVSLNRKVTGITGESETRHDQSLYLRFVKSIIDAC